MRVAGVSSDAATPLAPRAATSGQRRPLHRVPCQSTLAGDPPPCPRAAQSRRTVVVCADAPKTRAAEAHQVERDRCASALAPARQRQRLRWRIRSSLLRLPGRTGPREPPVTRRRCRRSLSALRPPAARRASLPGSRDRRTMWSPGASTVSGSLTDGPRPCDRLEFAAAFVGIQMTRRPRAAWSVSVRICQRLGCPFEKRQM
jgi:hypothetical protein